MDELNVQQLWGISPYVDLVAATAAANTQQTAAGDHHCKTAVLQLCPYDCRHSLATVSNAARCAAAKKAAADSQVQHQSMLRLYVFETEPEGLARHMLLLMLLFDTTLTARERAEMFLELHGNVLLRQRTADWACTASRWLEAAVAGDLKQQQQQVQHPAQAMLGVFDLSMLKYKERDLLLETFQQYRSKSSFDMAAAWESRCRKWYGDRYDFRANMVDWDYHMRLSHRGTPFLEPAQGSIIHPYHFRHWRLTGVAYELRESSYTATNTSMLATAYGRTREYKDRYLRDVGRSVSAYGYWGDILNPPYHAFGTVADDAALFKQVNKQFSHTSVDVAEHNILGFIKQLCGYSQPAADQAAEHCNTSNSSGTAEAHRARAARGPTSLEQLTAAQQSTAQEEGQADKKQQQQGQQDEVCGSNNAAGAARGHHSATVSSKGGGAHVLSSDATGPADQQADEAAEQMQELSLQQMQQQTEAEKTAQQAATELAQMTEAVQALLGSVKITLLTGDLKRVLTGKANFAGRFAAATVGHRHVHLLGFEAGLADVMQPGAPVFVETGANMVQLNNEQVAAFEEKLVELAAVAGLQRHSAFDPQQQQQQQQQQQAKDAAAGEVAGAGSAARSTSSNWRLPPGHIAFCVGQ